MAAFDVSKEWMILLMPESAEVKKAAEDLARCIGFLSCSNKNFVRPLKIIEAKTSNTLKPPRPAILLSNENGSSARNGFVWNADADFVEIRGESGRGLCNGIYSFLAALGFTWPEPGEENLPKPETIQANGTDQSKELPLTKDKDEFRHKDGFPASFRRFAGSRKIINNILKNSEAFAAWAARKRYDAIIFPLEIFSSAAVRNKIKQLGLFAAEYGISLEAGGWDLSAFVPRNNFLLHSDSFRMEEGKREKAHHFCPTNPLTIKIINKTGKKIFKRMEGIKVFHFWPDMGAENVWCSCPTCRAFTPSEQNRMAVNAITDALSSINPSASVTFFEKADDEGNIPLRKNLSRLERLPEIKESFR